MSDNKTEEQQPDSGETIIKFKKVFKKPLRKRRQSDDNEIEEENADILLVLQTTKWLHDICNSNVIINSIIRSKLEETKELQKLRQRPHGVSVAELAIGKKISGEEDKSVIVF